MFYYFILGKNKNLSIAELLNRPEIKKLKLDKKAVFLVENVLFLETDSELNATKLINFLGGTIKIGKIEKRYKDFSEIKTQDIIRLIKNREGKITFGFSLVGIKSKRFLKNLAIGVKKEFRLNKMNSRWVEANKLSASRINFAESRRTNAEKCGKSNESLELSSVVVKKNSLLKKGAEIYLFKIPSVILSERSESKPVRPVGGDLVVYMGKTLAVQDFESYGKRDYGRPGRDIRSGMIPPKLAQIMINLSDARENDLILDPFCGSGTILQEAILMGYKKIIGSDKSKKAINDSGENLKWLEQNWKLKTGNCELLHLDAKKLLGRIKENSIKAIVAEPYLGPTAKIRNPESGIRDLSDLYAKAFREFKRVVKEGGRVVIILPAFNKKRRISLQGSRYNEKSDDSEIADQDLSYLSVLPQIQSFGFKIAPFVPKEFNTLLQTTSRGSILYSRPTPNQRVVREIFIFEKK